MPEQEQLPGQTLGPYVVPALFKNWKFGDAVLLREQYEKGQLSAKEWNQILGSKSDNPVPNLKFMWNNTGRSSNVPVSIGGANNVNKTLRALKEMEMYACSTWRWTPEAKAADVIMPLVDQCEWDYGPTAGYSGFGYARKLVEPRGEARSVEWIDAEVAKRLGVLEYFMPSYQGKSWEDFEAIWDDALDKGIQAWSGAAHVKAYYRMCERPIPTNLDELKRMNYVLVPGEVRTGYSTALQRSIETGQGVVMRGKVGKPFWTKSGKFEIYSDYLAQGEEFLKTTKYAGQVWPMPMWDIQQYGYLSEEVKKYPLNQLHCHPRHRGNVATVDNNPYMRNDIFRGSVWVSLADAKARGIKDGDLVRVYNDVGEMAIPAYVTSRVIPGVVHVFPVRHFEPNRAGVDRRGSDCVTMHDEVHNCIQEPYNTLVEVEKY
jgi:anaerobic dimethyl sulfoxide reductase subunit A